MATAGSMLSGLRTVTGDPAGDWLTEALGYEFLNKAQKQFSNHVPSVEDFADYTVAARQRRYPLPSDCLTPKYLIWFKSGHAKRLNYVPPHGWADLEVEGDASTGTPDSYTIMADQIVLGRSRPATDSATALASGEIGAADTTLNLTAASGTFRGAGFVKIENEIVEYTGVATTTLTGCSRGVHNTPAASHASGTVVTQVDMQLFYRRPPNLLSASTDVPEIPLALHPCLEQYALYLIWVARGDMGKAEAARQEFERMVRGSLTTAGRRTHDGMMLIQERLGGRRWARW